MDNNRVKLVRCLNDDKTIGIDNNMESFAKEIEKELRKDRIQKISFWVVIMTSMLLFSYISFLIYTA